jgi:hypothetical protein
VDVGLTVKDEPASQMAEPLAELSVKRRRGASLRVYVKQEPTLTQTVNEWVELMDDAQVQAWCQGYGATLYAHGLP